MGNLDFTISVLEEDEDILASLNCNLKSFIDFTIVDQDGVLLVTNKRVLFCKYKGRDLSVVHDFEYNGDRVKITNITGGDILEVAYIMSKKQRIL